MKIIIGIVIGGVLAVSSPYASTWFARVGTWIREQAPNLVSQIQDLIS